MKTLAARSRVPVRAAAPLVVRDRSGIGAVVFLMMALVFAPVVSLYVVCLVQPAGATKSITVSGGGGSVRGVKAAPANG